VRDEDGAHALVLQQLAHLLARLLAEQGVEVGEGLVEQDEVRLRGEGAGEGHALLLPPREVLGLPVLKAAEAHHLQGLPGADLRLGPGRPVEPERDVVEHRQVREEGVVLKDDADRPSLRRHVHAGARELLSPQRDGTGRGALEAGDAAERRRFAAPARPQNSKDLAVLHVERHLVHDGRGVGVEPLGQVLNREEWVAHDESSTRFGPNSFLNRGVNRYN
jgi:hypothetical protein